MRFINISFSGDPIVTTLLLNPPMKKRSSGSDAFWRRAAMLFVSLCMATFARGAEDFSRVRITEVVHEANAVSIKHTTEPGFYYVLLRGENVLGIFQPI